MQKGALQRAGFQMMLWNMFFAFVIYSPGKSEYSLNIHFF